GPAPPTARWSPRQRSSRSAIAAPRCPPASGRTCRSRNGEPPVARSCMRGVKLIVTACLLFAACAPEASPALPSDWSIHDAAGLRIAAPTAWAGPDVLPATDSTGGPRAWIVFRDRSGAEAVTLMTWRDAPASALAAAQY